MSFLRWRTNILGMINKLKLAEKIELVMDLVERGEINTAGEARKEFAGYKIDFSLLDEILKEEFEEGFSERWEELSAE